MLINSSRVGVLIFDGYEVLNSSQKSSFDVDFDRRTTYAHLDRHNNLWVAQDGGGLVKITPDTVLYLNERNYPTVPAFSKQAFGIYEKGDTLFVGTTAGFYLLNSITNEVMQVVNVTDYFSVLENDKKTNDVRRFYPVTGKPNQVWCFGKGLFKYDITNNDLEYYPSPPGFVEDLGGNADLRTDAYLLIDLIIQNERLYFSSWGGGIVEYNPKQESWKKYPFEPYVFDQYVLDQNIALGMKPINDTLVSFAAWRFRGGFFDTKNRQFIPFDSIALTPLEDSGLSYDDVYFDGQNIWTGNRSNFCKYPLKPEYHRPSKGAKETVYLFDVKANNESLLATNRFYPAFERQLEIEQRSLFFDFRYVLAGNSDQLQYEYQLVGYDDRWVTAGSNHYAQYSKLTGGSYTFRARAKNLDLQHPQRVYSEDYSFSIGKKIYEQWWFYLGIAVTLFSLARFYWYYSRRVQEEKLRARLMLQEAQLSALRAQMNPHFLFNSLSSINNYIMQEEPRKASRYLTKFSQLMRKILNNSSQNLISLQEELQMLELYTQMENARFDEKFDLRIHIDEGIKVTDTYIPSMLLQPYIENAIHHGLISADRQGYIHLNFSVKEHKFLSITIEDNGIGRERALALKREKSIKNESMGMKITQKRIQLIENIYSIKTKVSLEDLEDQSGQAQGTKVVLQIPLIHSKNLNKYVKSS